MSAIRRTCLVLFALALAACGGAAGSAPAANGSGMHTIAAASQLVGDAAEALPQVGQLAPDFQYTLPDGSQHRLSDLRGKKVLINFWATWCAPCRSEMPDLQRALGEAGDSTVVLGVNKAEDVGVIAPFADELQVRFTLIANPAGDIANRYAAQLLPTSYFLNSDGTIALRKTGVMNYSFIQTHLAELK